MISLFVLKILTLYHPLIILNSMGGFSSALSPSKILLGPSLRPIPIEDVEIRSKDLYDLSHGIFIIGLIANIVLIILLTIMQAAFLLALQKLNSSNILISMWPWWTFVLCVTLATCRVLPVRFIARIYDGQGVCVSLWNAELRFPRKECTIVVRQWATKKYLTPVYLYHIPSGRAVLLWPRQRDIHGFLVQWHQDNVADHSRPEAGAQSSTP